MSGPTPDSYREALPFVRLMMVLSSLTPLFVLWAIRGMSPIPDCYLWTACAVLIAFPNVTLAARCFLAKRRNLKSTIEVKSVQDHKDHLLVYLFATLLPLFDANIGNGRDTAATVAAFTFIVFLFFHLHLHYLNILFAILGYRVYSIGTAEASAPPFVILSKRSSIAQGASLITYRLSNTVFLEMES